jgi:hypothetical protein
MHRPASQANRVTDLAAGHGRRDYQASMMTDNEDMQRDDRRAA